MIDNEKNKMQKHIEWLKQHLNTDKTPEQLDAEFEIWYKEDFKKRQDAETLEKLKQSVQYESCLTYSKMNTDYDPLSYQSRGTIALSRVCALQAFVNSIRLKAAEHNGRYRIVLENPDTTSQYGLASCEISGLEWEPSDTWFRHNMTLIAETGRFEDSISSGVTIWVKPYNSITAEEN